jgi:tRNA(fMet)-specific endonuclease VapC
LAFLIDTNIAIHARDGTDSVLDKLAEHDGAVLLSALSLAELERGVYKNPAYAALRRARLDVLMAYIPVLFFDSAAAQIYGQIIAQCGWIKGDPQCSGFPGYSRAGHRELDCGAIRFSPVHGDRPAERIGNARG